MRKKSIQFNTTIKNNLKEKFENFNENFLFKYSSENTEKMKIKCTTNESKTVFFKKEIINNSNDTPKLSSILTQRI